MAIIVQVYTWVVHKGLHGGEQCLQCSIGVVTILYRDGAKGSTGVLYRGLHEWCTGFYMGVVPTELVHDVLQEWSTRFYSGIVQCSTWVVHKVLHR